MQTYIQYLISNLIVIDNWIEKFGVSVENDGIIKKHVDQISIEMNGILQEMKLMGINVSEMFNESYDIEANVRDFKLKRILDNESL